MQMVDQFCLQINTDRSNRIEFPPPSDLLIGTNEMDTSIKGFYEPC